MNSRLKWLILSAVAVGVLLFILHKKGVGNYFTLHQLQHHSAYLKYLVECYHVWAIVVYISAYALIIACALPAVAPLTILGGYLFYAVPGAIYAIVGATLGCIASFLFVRYAIGYVVRYRYGGQLDSFNERIKVYGYTYLLTLQLVTIVPFFVINTLAALADVPLLTFIWTTVVGSAPLIFIYAFAGRQLGEISSVKDILKPPILGALVLLACIALLPMVVRWVRRWLQW